VCGLSVEALKRDVVNKRSNASMDKSFDGMHEKYKSTISIRFDVQLKKNDFDFDDRNISNHYSHNGKRLIWYAAMKMMI